MTTVCAKWFPVKRRAAIVGVMIVAVNLGSLCGNFLTPILVMKYGIPAMLKIQGVLCLFIGCAFMLLIRESEAAAPEARAIAVPE